MQLDKCGLRETRHAASDLERLNIWHDIQTDLITPTTQRDLA
jgi:hypothetical protein